MKRTDPPPSQRWALYASHLGEYMHRWILRTPWGTLRIHHILKSDEGRDFHDHPFSFTSLILRGGYLEHRPGCSCVMGECGSTPQTCAAPNCKVGIHCREYFAPALVRRRGEDLHRLELARGSSAWTFVITSRYFRNWGFMTPTGWVPYQEYSRNFDEPEVTP